MLVYISITFCLSLFWHPNHCVKARSIIFSFSHNCHPLLFSQQLSVLLQLIFLSLREKLFVNSLQSVLESPNWIFCRMMYMPGSKREPFNSPPCGNVSQGEDLIVVDTKYCRIPNPLGKYSSLHKQRKLLCLPKKIRTAKKRKIASNILLASFPMCVGLC